MFVSGCMSNTLKECCRYSKRKNRDVIDTCLIKLHVRTETLIAHDLARDLLPLMEGMEGMEGAEETHSKPKPRKLFYY
jgi:hypothetical protein